ncbi:hypothetical protein [Haloarchaeobius sp. DT45]|uniref:hypothetical protein n=1 Tax=Haloarchaeobius sp. DT45 TaxID=3446116 RepID=UPI003F6CD02E
MGFSGAPRTVSSGAITLLLVLVLLTACLGAPSSDSTPSTGDRNFTVGVTGDSNASVYVNVYLLTEPDRPIEVEYLNGSTETREFPSRNRSVSYGPESSVKSVTVPDRDHQVDRVVFEGEPEWSVEAADIAPARAAVYVVRIDGGDRVASWGIVVCGHHVRRLDVETNGSAVTGTGVSCEG